ncbi:hypothetical protein AAAC51_06895 [Priestia megaterium]
MNSLMENKQQVVSYNAQSRGHKTKGNTYKDRYVQNACPECGNPRSYKDEWKTRIKYTCLKRACRHQWFEKREFPVDAQ